MTQDGIRVLVLNSQYSTTETDVFFRIVKTERGVIPTRLGLAFLDNFEKQTPPPDRSRQKWVQNFCSVAKWGREQNENTILPAESQKVNSVFRKLNN